MGRPLNRSGNFRRGRLLWWMVVAGVLFAPWAYASGRVEWRIARELEQLGRELPDNTQLLTINTEVIADAGSCRGVVAKMLATELRPAELARFLDAGEPERGPTYAAYGNLAGFHVVTSSGPVTGAPPPAVHSLLARWFPMPKGAKRVVVFRSFALDERWDPRCLL